MRQTTVVERTEWCESVAELVRARGGTDRDYRSQGRQAISSASSTDPATPIGARASFPPLENPQSLHEEPVGLDRTAVSRWTREMPTMELRAPTGSERSMVGDVSVLSDRPAQRATAAQPVQDSTGVSVSRGALALEQTRVTGSTTA